MADRSAESVVAVALLYDKADRSAHLRDALSALGANVVYEAATGEIDRKALDKSLARVVVVNLEGQNEADLDEVYGLLDDSRYHVIFNDSDVSGSLSGWDHARWARHLAVKIIGGDIDPPRPADAESVPAPTPVVHAPAAAGPASPPAALAVDAAAHANAVEVASALLAETIPATDATDEAAAEWTASVAASSDPTAVVDETNGAADVGAASPPHMTTIDVPAADPESVDAVAMAFDDPAPFDGVDGLPAGNPANLLDFDFDGLEEAPPQPPTAAVTDEFDFTDIEDLAATFEAAVPVAEPDDLMTLDFDAAPPEPPSAQEGHAVEPEPPRVFALGDALTLVPEDDAPAADSVAPTPPAQARSLPATEVAAPAGWSLEDMLDDVGAIPLAPPPPTGPAQFGIEKLSAEEFLAPGTGDADNGIALDESVDDLSFELIPLEEAVAPTQLASAGHESWLVPDTTAVSPKVRRVWVLGASIGGPESMREFLNRFPRTYPALFVLAQHLGSEFVDLMTKQLARGTALTIRTPTHGERVGHGEVVVVPTTHRLLIDPDGVVVLEKNAVETAYSPSIDRVLQDVADRFGAAAGAIIFSGMSTDAVEGATYLVQKGGRVYAQTPETCVVSSMVDGVTEAGIVSFHGSPVELAEKLLAEANP